MSRCSDLFTVQVLHTSPADIRTPFNENRAKSAPLLQAYKIVAASTNELAQRYRLLYISWPTNNKHLIHTSPLESKMLFILRILCFLGLALVSANLLDAKPATSRLVAPTKGHRIQSWPANAPKEGGRNRRDQNIPIPTIPTMAPTTPLEDLCPGERATAELCTNTSAPSCLACVEDALAALQPGTWCSIAEAEVCQAIESTCGCGPCIDEVEEYASCVHGKHERFDKCRSLNCTVWEQCDTELAVADACLGTGAPTCFDCVSEQLSAFYDQEENPKCYQWARVMCDALNATCDCDPCGDEMEEYFICNSAAKDGCTNLDCDNPDPCYQARDDMYTCLESAPASCLDCIFEVEEEAVEQQSCAMYELAMCRAFQTDCDCEPCTEELEKFYSCFNQDICGDTECEIAMQCETELSIFDVCLGVAAPDCLNCVWEAENALFSDEEEVKCYLYDQTLCSAIYDDCDCEPCTDEYEEYESCWRTASGICGPLDCSTANDCITETSAYFSCKELASPSCTDCLVAAEAPFYNDTIEGLPCILFDSTMCAAIQNECDCSPCQEEIEDFYACFILEDWPGNSCNFDCSSDPCVSKLTSMNACLEGGPNSCRDCINSAYNALAEKSNLDCNDFVTDLCPAVESDCDCGTCRDEIEVYYNCMMHDAVNGCNDLDCGLTFPTAPPATESRSSSGGSSAAVAAGAAVGGVAVVAALIGFFVFHKRRGARDSLQPTAKETPREREVPSSRETKGSTGYDEHTISALSDHSPPHSPQSNRGADPIPQQMPNRTDPEPEYPTPPPHGSLSLNASHQSGSMSSKPLQRSQVEAPVPNNYTPDFKDQVRTVRPVVEEVPMAPAVLAPLPTVVLDNNSIETEQRSRRSVDP